MQTMYPGMVNSPVTELASSITAGQTTITVLNGDALPDAPNLAVIGQGELAETILYTDISGNNLSGITRGFQGTARAWAAGISVSRNFTEADYATLVANITELDTTKAGTAVATTSVNGLMSAADKQLSANRDGYGTTAGSATAYTLALTPAPTLVAGLRVTVKLHTASGANPTLNVNGLGARSIRKADGMAPAAGLLKSGGVYTMVYDGTAFILQGEGGEYGTAVAAEVLAGKTIGTESGLVTGTMPNRTGDVTGQSVSRNGTTLRIRPQAGYYPGDAGNSVQIADANYIASNIRDGVSLFGLTGTLIEGKRWASGTVMSSASMMSFTTLSGGSQNESFIQVSQALGFTPSTVIILYSLSGLTVCEVPLDNYAILSINRSGTMTEYRLSGNAYCDSTGFRLPVKWSDRNHTWTAYE